MALAVMFFFPGMPMLFAGDEIGTEGGYDPGCRRCFRWERESWDAGLYGLVQRLAALKKGPCLSRGGCRISESGGVVAIERDPDLPAVLADTLHPWREKFALIEKDALDVTRDDIVAAMVEIGGDTGYPDRASSAANETAQWAVSQSEDCLSESGYPPAPPQETSNQTPEEDPHPEFAHIRLLMGAESYYLYDDSAMTDAYARWAFLAAEDDPVATFIECVREESSVYPRPMARENLANDPFRMNAEAVEAAFAEARAQGRADDIERVEASNGDVYFYSTTYLTPRRAQALAEWDAVERIRNV